MNAGLSRRRLLAAAGAALATPALLAACGDAPTNSGPGTTGADDLKKALPDYIPSRAVTADIPSVTGAGGAASDSAFLSYPKDPVATVGGTPGKGGTYVTRTPLWGSIPPSSGNAYYDAVNKALGATLKLQPSDGNTYVDSIPALFASGNLPDWLQIPGWANAKLNLGAALDRFADLTPYLSGGNVARYPNLAAIASAAWQAGVWNGKLYGLPCFPSAGGFGGYIFYRKDLLDAAGAGPELRHIDDLFALGAKLTDTGAGRWAFDDLWPYLKFPFGLYGKWSADASGKLVNQYETEAMLEALNFAAKIAKSGYVHPDALANNTQQGRQRFWSGKVAVQGGGTGGWDGDDAKGGLAADAQYNRQAFKVFSASGGTAGIELSPGAGWFSYLNKKLSDAQIRECLAIADYLAAPYGSKEYLLVNFGAESVDFTMTGGNPVLTGKGQQEVAQGYQFLVSPPAVTLVKNGLTQVVKDFAAWQADAVKHAVRPLFYGMNIAEPAQYASIEQQVEDTIKDVRFGRKPIGAFKSSVDTWRKQGGDQLRRFYDDIRGKYGTGQ
ncbi:extracellular solute-binding protein [Dactylosporangium vinaceum]|uniref:Extracellular solute-binding protein n=1 Tax=Dactylosporangium vinaceum TaxID=53362 RepID=A0ABV5LZC3_9ACTN|nr:extracellular solute-binding protein [Dactylosporangium vinaceum]UAB92589.1 extracellular solute-binding protein [Dactylosporangium vinaceum]